MNWKKSQQNLTPTDPTLGISRMLLIMWRTLCQGRIHLLFAIPNHTNLCNSMAMGSGGWLAVKKTWLVGNPLHFLYDTIIYHQDSSSTILYHIILYHTSFARSYFFLWIIRRVHDLGFFLRLWLPIQQEVAAPSLTAL